MPDLCRLPRIAAMLGIAELVVAVVALAPASDAWETRRFLSASGYALWVCLMISALLCVLRQRLSRLPPRAGALAAMLIATFVALVAATIVHALFASVDQDALPGFARFVFGTVAIAILITALALRYFYVIDRWQAQTTAHARAEADALQARIRPHFLFNSMNTIVGLVRRDPATAERAVLDLSDLFRAALQAGEVPSSLAEEVELAERYLAIEALRLGDRLQVQWSRHEPLPWRQPLPRLVLQPLVENAVLHGVSQLPEGGTIEISLSHADGLLRMQVGNPAPRRPRMDGGGTGHAQRSIAHRLSYAFGARAGMTSRAEDGYYRCELVVPIQPQGVAGTRDATTQDDAA